LSIPVPPTGFIATPPPDSVAYTGAQQTWGQKQSLGVHEIKDCEATGRRLTESEMRGVRTLPTIGLRHRFVKTLALKRKKLQNVFGHDNWGEEDVLAYARFRDEQFDILLQDWENSMKYTTATKEAKARKVKSALGISSDAALKLTSTQVDQSLPPLRDLGSTGSPRVPRRGRGRQRAFDFCGNPMQSDMMALIRFEKQQLFSNAVAVSTKKRYESNYKFWVEFCRAVGRDPLIRGIDVPAETELICDYVVYEHCIQKNGIGTVKNKLWALRFHNMEFNLPNPLQDKPQLDRLLKSIKLKNAKVNRKMPVTPQMLRYILNAADMSQLRTRAVVTSIIFAFGFLLRISEYAAETVNVVGPHVIRRHHVVFKRGGFVVSDP